MIFVTHDKKTIELFIEEPIETKKNIGFILMTHGIFTNHRESKRFDRYSSLLQGMGYVVIRYDHRGHGTSSTNSKDMTVVDTVLDFDGIVKFLAIKLNSTINIVASSYGAAIFLLALQLNKFLPVSNVVLLNPVVDFQTTFINPTGEQMQPVFGETNIEILKQNHEFHAINGIIISYKFYTELSLLNPYLAIKDLTNNVSVIHGRLDSAVSYIICRDFFSQNEKVNFITFENSNHAFTDKESEAQLSEVLKNIF